MLKGIGGDRDCFIGTFHSALIHCPHGGDDQVLRHICLDLFLCPLEHRTRGRINQVARQPLVLSQSRNRLPLLTR